ncbi:MAG: hypothetical protein RI897_2505 [Verrucomicrobiota bacterium]
MSGAGGGLHLFQDSALHLVEVLMGDESVCQQLFHFLEFDDGVGFPFGFCVFDLLLKQL